MENHNAYIFLDQHIYPYRQKCQVFKYFGINILKFRTSISIHLFFILDDGLKMKFSVMQMQSLISIFVKTQDSKKTSALLAILPTI